MRVNNRVKNLLPIICFYIVLAIAYFVYFPGTRGDFLFDDYPNLSVMGVYGGVTDLESFRAFVFQGYSGPLGRPVALVSFLLDDYTWPSQAEPFKLTNIKIHLLCGLLLIWGVFNFLRLYGKSETISVWSAVVCGAIWLLHPLMVSTTLYVVQRMAQLATLFVYAGIAGYFCGRYILAQGRVLPAYAVMSFSLGVMTILAAFSKENGVMLPLLVLILECFLPSSKVRLNTYWLSVFLILPSLAFGWVLFREINLAPAPWPNRNFNQIERLLSESRIVCEYLWHIWVPQVEAKGFFQDGFVISKSLFSPITTLFSVLTILGLVALSFVLRRKLPLVSLSIVFFFATHLLESTHLGLELYFEHRNYMGAGFLFLALAVLLVELSAKFSVSFSAIVTLLLLGLLTFLTYQRVYLWSDGKRLERFWATSAPDSPRAQSRLAYIFWQDGQPRKAIQQISLAVERFPKSGLVAFNYLILKADMEIAKEKDFEQIADLIAQQPFDAQGVMGIRNLVDLVISKKNNHPEYLKFTMNLLEKVKQDPRHRKTYQFNKLYPYCMAKLQLAAGDYDLALHNFTKAIVIQNDMDAALSMVAILGNESRPIEANLLLRDVEKLYKNPKVSLRRSREVYDAEIINLKNIIKNDLAAIGISDIKIEE